MASQSTVRARLLAAAGIDFETRPAALDEAPIKQAGLADGLAVAVIAARLASAKAGHVAAQNPGAYVIGADQILDCDGQMFDKPPTMDAAAEHLQALRARTHRLVTAACVRRDGHRLWSCETEARLTMRSIDDEAIGRYLERAGPDVLQSVGAYRLEGLGANLFERVEGDYFTVLGLPLLPLLSFLRGHGLAPS